VFVALDLAIDETEAEDWAESLAFEVSHSSKNLQLNPGLLPERFLATHELPFGILIPSKVSQIVIILIKLPFNEWRILWITSDCVLVVELKWRKFFGSIVGETERKQTSAGGKRLTMILHILRINKISFPEFSWNWNKFQCCLVIMIISTFSIIMFLKTYKSWFRVFLCVLIVYSSLLRLNLLLYSTLRLRRMNAKPSVPTLNWNLHCGFLCFVWIVHFFVSCYFLYCWSCTFRVFVLAVWNVSRYCWLEIVRTLYEAFSF